MGLLFILALLLAWPTLGLSLVAWFVLVFLKAAKRAKASAQREVIAEVIEPLFKGRFADFYDALDVPYRWDAERTQSESHQCGRFIMKYLAHNPSEAAIFTRGLKRLAAKGSGQLCDPVQAAEFETRYDEKREIHLTAYRAIEALMSQNNLPCFQGVDLDAVSQYTSAIESRERLQGSA
jgi:hypothetical protein